MKRKKVLENGAGALLILTTTMPTAYNGYRVPSCEREEREDDKE
jgi:hypothetical protein